MNKIISTKERVFISLVGPSGCGKSRLIVDWLTNGTFKPAFDKILYFYQYHQPLYEEMQIKIRNIEFIQGVDFELINNLPNNGTNYLLIFDDSCEEISKSRDFVKIATAGRHRGFNTIYIKHNLFHKSPIGRDVELQNTHIALFKSPRDVMQIMRLGQQLGLGKLLNEWYKDATSKPYGHLLVDLSPQTVDQLRFCTDSGSTPTKFYLPPSQAKITFLDDEHTKRSYSETVPNFQSKVQKNFHSKLSKRIHSFSKRVPRESATRTNQRYTKSKRGKVQKTNKKVNGKKNNITRKKNGFSLTKGIITYRYD